MPAYSFEGLRPVVAPGAFVHPDAVLIGDVHIGPKCYIAPLASLRGDFGRIVVGAGSNVQDGCVLHAFPGRDLILHRDSHVGHAAILHGCTVRSFALVGMNAVVMDGAVVGEGALVAAGATVPGGMEIPARHLAAGSPARVVRELDEESVAWKSNGVRVYQELAVRCSASIERVAPLEEPEPGRRRNEATGSATRSMPLHEIRQGRKEWK